MTGPTHFLAGCATALGGLVCFHQPPGLIMPALAVGGLAALLPDVDHPDGSLTKLLGTRRIAEHIPHRGPTHSLVAAAAAGAALWLLKTPPFFLIIFLTGYLSHLLLDCLNPAGLRILWPAGPKIRLPLGRVGEGAENLAVRPVVYLLIGILIVIYIKTWAPVLFKF